MRLARSLKITKYQRQEEETVSMKKYREISKYHYLLQLYMRKCASFLHRIGVEFAEHIKHSLYLRNLFARTVVPPRQTRQHGTGTAINYTSDAHTQSCIWVGSGTLLLITLFQACSCGVRFTVYLRSQTGRAAFTGDFMRKLSSEPRLFHLNRAAPSYRYAHA